MVGAQIGSCQALLRGGLSSGAVLLGGAATLPPSPRPDPYTFRIGDRENSVDFQSVPKSRRVALAKHVLIFNNSADMEEIRYRRILYAAHVLTLDENHLDICGWVVRPDNTRSRQRDKWPHGRQIFGQMAEYLTFRSNVEGACGSVVSDLDGNCVEGICRAYLNVVIADRDRNPRPLFILHHFDLRKSSLSTFRSRPCRPISRGCLFSHLVGLPSHFLYGLLPLEFHFLDLAIHVPGLSLHPIGLPVNILAGLAEQDRLPADENQLQESDYSQTPCEIHEPTLYLEILAACLCGLIMGWGGWLWGGGGRGRVYGGLVMVLCVWLFLSFFTGFLFNDPLFWRPLSHILTGQNPYHCQWDQQTEYRQMFHYDTENVSQIHLAVAWEPVRVSSSMGKLRLFFGSMFSELGSGLSGPASVPFAVLALFAPNPVQKIAYGGLAAILVFVSAYRIWLKEHTQKLGEMLKREKAEHEFLEGKPVLMLHIAYSDLKPNDKSGDVFRVQNCGTRAARWVHVKSVPSQLKHYFLRFGQIPVLTLGPSQGIQCHVWSQREKAGLWEFFHDSDPESAIVWFDTTIVCRDTNESIVETMVRIMFDLEAKRLEVCAVPYTQKPPIKE